MHLSSLAKVCVVVWYFSFECAADDYMNPEWVDPHSWSTDKDPLAQLCPQSEPCKPCEKDARPEYLRLVNTLFNPNEFRFDESTKYLYRTVHIHATKEQLEKLKKITDTTHIDGLISEILAQSQFGTVQLVKELTIDVMATVWERIPRFDSDILPRSKPVFINFGLLVFSYFLCRRFNISFLIAVFFAVIYFLYEYLDYECRKRIELDEAVEFIYGKQKNPCMSPAKGNLFDWILGKDSRTLCREYLAKQTHVKNQCGVVDLFHEFTTNILLKQLKLFIIAISELVQSISTTNGILITAVTLYFMKDILTTIIHSMFKFILNPTIWSRVVADMSPNRSEENRIPARQRLASDSDLRDQNLSKALDLANYQIELLLRQKSVTSSNMQPSSVEILPISEKSEKNTTNEHPNENLNDNPNESSETKIDKKSDIDEHNTSSGCDSCEGNIEEEISVFVVDRSRSKSNEFRPQDETPSEESDKSLGSDSSKLSSDIEFIPDFSTSTALDQNSNR